MEALTASEIAEVNEIGEAEAYLDYFRCAPPEFAQAFGLGVRQLGSIYVTIISKVDNLNHNRIMGWGLREPATEASLDNAIAVFQKEGCHNYLVQISSLIQPAKASEWLARRGFTQGRSWAKMFRGNEAAPAVSTDLRVEKIGKGQAEAYASVVLPAFGIKPHYRPLVKGNVGKPGWQHYLAFAGEKPVSAAGMYINEETAWLSFAATLEEYRGHGGQSAMLARRIEDGLERGCKWFVAETKEDTPDRPNPSYRNMKRCGFKLAYLQQYYYHQQQVSPVRKVRHAFIIGVHRLKSDFQRLLPEKRTG